MSGRVRPNDYVITQNWSSLFVKFDYRVDGWVPKSPKYWLCNIWMVHFLYLKLYTWSKFLSKYVALMLCIFLHTLTFIACFWEETTLHPHGDIFLSIFRPVPFDGQYRKYNCTFSCPLGSIFGVHRQNCRENPILGLSPLSHKHNKKLLFLSH